VDRWFVEMGVLQGVSWCLGSALGQSSWVLGTSIRRTKVAGQGPGFIIHGTNRVSDSFIKKKGLCSVQPEVGGKKKKKIKIKIKGLGDDMENQPKKGSCGRMGSLPKGCCCSSKQGGQRWEGWTLFYFDGRCCWC